MNKAEAHRYYNQKFNEIPVELFPKIKDVFDKNLNEDFVTYAKKMIKEKGLNSWFVDQHFFTGMAIRNLLRDSKVMDNLFPDQNLDDYYVPMIEWWLGYRKNNRVIIHNNTMSGCAVWIG